jgi:probable phosphoglycerate mutase
VHEASNGSSRAAAARAQQTAAPLPRRLGLAPEVVDGWAEADRHLDRYRSVEDAEGDGRRRMAAFSRGSGALHGAEIRLSFRPACWRRSRRCVAGGPRDAHVAVFTHGLPINVALSHALRPRAHRPLPAGLGSVTRLRSARHPHDRVVVSVNETGHLAP